MYQKGNNFTFPQNSGEYFREQTWQLMQKFQQKVC